MSRLVVSASRDRLPSPPVRRSSRRALLLDFYTTISRVSPSDLIFLVTLPVSLAYLECTIVGCHVISVIGQVAPEKEAHRVEPCHDLEQTAWRSSLPSCMEA
jgi:hypothetical protein